MLGAGFGAAVLILAASGRHAHSTSTSFSGTVGGLYLVTGLLAHLRNRAATRLPSLG